MRNGFENLHLIDYENIMPSIYVCAAHSSPHMSELYLSLENYHLNSDLVMQCVFILIRNSIYSFVLMTYVMRDKIPFMLDYSATASNTTSIT